MTDETTHAAEPTGALLEVEDLPFAPPLGMQFGDRKFLESEALEGLMGEEIAEHFVRRQWIAELFNEGDIGIVWKKTGGKHLGKCSLANPIARHYDAPMFFIWLAADHLRDMAANRGQLKALIHHELLHIGFDDESGSPLIVRHDAEVFVEELRDHAIWRGDLAPLVATCVKLGAAA